MDHESPGSLLDRTADDNDPSNPLRENLGDEQESTVDLLQQQLEEARATIDGQRAYIAELEAGVMEDTIRYDEQQKQADAKKRALQDEADAIMRYVIDLESTVQQETAEVDEAIKEREKRIASLKNRAVELRAQASTDELSGLGNRLGFEAKKKRFESEEGKAQVCAYFDLGNLTGANNTGGELGHDFGDTVIKHTATSLLAAARECNEYLPEGHKISLERGLFDLHRQGGDEFAAFLPNMTISYPRTNSEGDHVLVEEPVAKVFVEQAIANFGIIPFCGNMKGEKGTEASERILGVCSLAGGAATGGEPGATNKADAACKEDKQANRERVISQFLLDHARPALDGIGRLVQVELNPDAHGGIISIQKVIDGFEMPPDKMSFDKVILDKWSTQYVSTMSS